MSVRLSVLVVVRERVCVRVRIYRASAAACRQPAFARTSGACHNTREHFIVRALHSRAHPSGTC